MNKTDIDNLAQCHECEELFELTVDSAVEANGVTICDTCYTVDVDKDIEYTYARILGYE